MLDIMELRGFKAVVQPGRHVLITPDGFQFVVQYFPQLSNMQCVFAAFEALNPTYP